MARADAVRRGLPAARAPRARVLDVLVAVLPVVLAFSITLSELTLLALAVAVLAGGRREALSRAPLAAPVAAFAVWSVVAALASAQPWDSVRAAKSVLVLAALWIVAAALPDAPAAHRFATALSVAVAAVAVVAVAQVVTCTPARYDAVDPALPPLVRSVLGKCRRAHGFYSIYMTLAGVLAVVLAAALPRLPALPRRGWAVAGWFVGAAALVLTIARSAWAGFAAGAVAAAALRRRGGRGRRTRGWQAAAGAAGLVALAVVLGVVVPDVRERARTIGDLRDDTTRERVTMLGIGLRLIAEHPVAGVGPGQVKHLYPLHAPPDALRRHTSHLHNTPLQIAVERGLVGLAIWLWIFVAFVRRAAGALRRLPAEAGADRALVVGSLAGVTAFLVAGVFEYNFGDTEVLLVVLSVMALPFVVERDRAGRAA